MEKEMWAVMPLFTNYLISNYGRVKRKIKKGEKLLKCYKNSIGYMCFGKWDYEKKQVKTYLIHRLVALAFIPNHSKKPHVNHIDGNKENNYIKNLEWVTHRENIIKAHEIGLCKNKEGEGHYLAKLKKEDINIIRHSPLGCCELSRIYGVSHSTIGSVKKGETWKSVK